MKIKCSECGKEFSFGTLGRCPCCEGILQLVYSDQSILGLKDSKLAEAEAEAISRQSPVPFDVEGIVAEVRKYKSPPTPLF